jgi:hypothetical protein
MNAVGRLRPGRNRLRLGCIRQLVEESRSHL